jgi:hypothetical protein
MSTTNRTCIAPTIAETELLHSSSGVHGDVQSKDSDGVRIGQVAKMVAWTASPACSFAFDRTGGRATY